MIKGGKEIILVFLSVFCRMWIYCMNDVIPLCNVLYSVCFFVQINDFVKGLE